MTVFCRIFLKTVELQTFNTFTVYIWNTKALYRLDKILIFDIVEQLNPVYTLLCNTALQSTYSNDCVFQAVSSMTSRDQYYCPNTFSVSPLRVIYPAYLTCDLTTSNTEFAMPET